MACCLEVGMMQHVELAHHESGSIEAFVDRMNKKAKDIGIVNTVFKIQADLMKKMEEIFQQLMIWRYLCAMQYKIQSL